MVVSQVKSETENQFVVAFRALKDERPNGPSWVDRVRTGALDRFEELGIPTVRHEEWKYTSPAAIAKTKFAFSAEPPDGTVEIETHFYPEAASSRIVFVNGRFSSEHSALDGVPAGVVVQSLALALLDHVHGDVIREHLARTADYQEKAFDALNTAFLHDGAFVYVPRGVQATTPIHLLFVTQASGAPLAVFPRVLIVCDEGSEATVIESHVGSEGEYLSTSVAEVVLAPQARLTHYLVQNQGPNATHLASTNAVVDRSAAYDTTAITLGAKLSRHDITVKLEGEGAECWVDGLYIVGDGQHADTHSAIHHLQPHGTSHQLYKGILDGKSRAVFNGKVFVHVDAQQTDARQTNRNLLLSNDARIDTKPQLEIFADDVKCAHGATVGQLEEEELFYLISRGLHPELARNLLTYGFAEEVIARITIESIKAQLDEAVLHRLRARLEA